MRHCHQQGIVHCNIHPTALVCFLEPRKTRSEHSDGPAMTSLRAARGGVDDVEDANATSGNSRYYGEMVAVWKVADFDHAHLAGSDIDVLDLPVLRDVDHAYYMPPDAALAYVMNCSKIVASFALDLWAVGTLICAIYKARNVMLDRGSMALRALLATDGPRVLSFMPEPLGSDDQRESTIEELAWNALQFELPSQFGDKHGRAQRKGHSASIHELGGGGLNNGGGEADPLGFLRVALSDGRALAVYKSKMAAAHGILNGNPNLVGGGGNGYGGDGGAMESGFRGSRTDDSETLANLKKLLIGRSEEDDGDDSELTGPMMLRPLQYLDER